MKTNGLRNKKPQCARCAKLQEEAMSWRRVAEGEAELRSIADDELKVSEGRVAELESLLRMIATRAQTFPDFPIGWHIPEVFRAVGMQMPERPENDDTHDGLRARVEELKGRLAEKNAELRAAAEWVSEVAEMLEDHPLFMGHDTTTDELDQAGGDAALITDAAIQLRGVLREISIDAAIAAGGGDG